MDEMQLVGRGRSRLELDEGFGDSRGCDTTEHCAETIRPLGMMRTGVVLGEAVVPAKQYSHRHDRTCLWHGSILQAPEASDVDP